MGEGEGRRSKEERMRVSNEPLRSCPVPKLFVASIMAPISRPKVSVTRCKFSLAHFLFIIDFKLKEGNIWREILSCDPSKFFFSHVSPRNGEYIGSLKALKRKKRKNKLDNWRRMREEESVL